MPKFAVVVFGAIRQILLLLKLLISALTTSTSTSKGFHVTKFHCFRIDLYHDKRFIHHSSTRSSFRLIDESMFDLCCCLIDWLNSDCSKEKRYQLFRNAFVDSQIWHALIISFPILKRVDASVWGQSNLIESSSNQTDLSVNN